MLVFVIKCILGAILALAFIIGIVVLVYKSVMSDWLL
jgi:hypothetical protein